MSLRRILPRRDKSPKRTLVLNRKLLLWVEVILFVGMQVMFAIHTATSGARLAALEVEQEAITKLNQQEKEQLVVHSSLSGIEKKADELGFGEPETVLYITVEDFVAHVP
jgi:hypothetical protein